MYFWYLKAKKKKKEIPKLGFLLGTYLLQTEETWHRNTDIPKPGVMNFLCSYFHPQVNVTSYNSNFPLDVTSNKENQSDKKSFVPLRSCEMLRNVALRQKWWWWVDFLFLCVSFSRESDSDKEVFVPIEKQNELLRMAFI